MHLFFCGGMEKSYFRRMETEAFCGRRIAVESVAEDGRIETIGMRGMYTELVGTAGKRIEIDEERAVRALLTYGETRDSRFAMLPIHHLAGTIIRIRQEGKGDEG